MDQALEKVEDLEQKLYELGATINAGNLVPSNTRVLQLSANPVQEDIDLKKQVFDSLKQENLALIERLGQVEHGRGFDSQSQVVPRQSWENLYAEKSELVTKVADKEKRLLRLKQVCSTYPWIAQINLSLRYSRPRPMSSGKLFQIFSATPYFSSLPKSD